MSTAPRKTLSFSAWLKLRNVAPSDDGYIPVYTDRKTNVSESSRKGVQRALVHER